MSHDLLAQARRNRLIALKTLECRKNNIFLLDDMRDKRAAQTTPVFASCRKPAQIAPVMIDKIAA